MCVCVCVYVYVRVHAHKQAGSERPVMWGRGWVFLSLFFNKFIYLPIYFWLRWVFVAARGLSLVVASGGYSSLRCVGFSCCGARALGAWASVVVARGLSSCGLWALERRLSSCGARA